MYLGPGDAVVAELSPDGTQLVYSSYLGGSHSGASPSTGSDVGISIALDAGGNPYVAGYTQSYDLPTTRLALARHLNPATCDVFGSPCGDAFFARLDLAAPAVVPPVSVTVTPTQVGQGGTLTASLGGHPDADQHRLGAALRARRDVRRPPQHAGLGMDRRRERRHA